MGSVSVRVVPVWIVLSRFAPESHNVLVMACAKMTHASATLAGLVRTALWRVARWCRTAPDMDTVSRANASARRAGRVIFATLRLHALVTAIIVACVCVESVTAGAAMVALPVSVRSVQLTAPDTAFVYGLRRERRVLQCNALAIMGGMGSTAPCPTARTTAQTMGFVIMGLATATTSGRVQIARRSKIPAPTTALATVFARMN